MVCEGTDSTLIKEGFGVSKKNTKNLEKRKRKIERRLRRKGWKAQAKPMFSAKNIHYLN